MQIVMKYVQHGSKWGNLYRVRSFINGVRVSDADFKRAYESAGLKPENGKFETGPGFWRKTWTETLTRGT